MRPNMLVVGSLVMDLIVTTNRFCNAGETVIGTGFTTAPGGKGANQAVQAARLGANVTMVGKVGDDDFGKRLIKSVGASGVNTEHIGITDTAPTAVGNVQIQANEHGTENRIIVVPGANMAIQPCDVVFLQNEVKQYDVVILQNEIPMEINRLVAQYAKYSSSANSISVSASSITNPGRACSPGSAVSRSPDESPQPSCSCT